MLGQRRGRLSLGICGTSLLAVGLCVAGLVGPAKTHAQSQALTALSRDVPSRHFAFLGSGRLHGTRWAVFASPSGDKRPPRDRPCLTVASADPDGAYRHVSACGPVAPRDEEPGSAEIPPVHPLIGGAYRLSPRGRSIEESFSAMSFAPSVERVKIDVEPEATIERVPRLLSVVKGAKAHLKRFKYVVLALNQVVCVKHITAYDALGRAIVDADGEECPLPNS